MNIFRKVYSRIYQNIFQLAIPLMPYRQPDVKKSVQAIPQILKDHKLSRPLLVTDKSIRGLGLTKELEDALSENLIAFVSPRPRMDLSVTSSGLESLWSFKI